MSNETELHEKITSLKAEVEQLKSRVAALENHSPKARPLISKPTLDIKGYISKEGLESLIGGQLLNRVGIIVLLFGVAYFLKYSFDNRWIGELGRVVIGFIGGITLLAAGNLMMKRHYRYFSQGFSGGGLGILYLTTFAAANYYHFFSPLVAFSILVLTAMTGGILSVRQNAYGVAVLAAVGGFLTPFLIGSREANPPALLSYIAVLDLAVIYLAYHKNWRSLNLLSFCGTALVYFLYQQSSFQQYQSNLWLNQFFLVLYFLIFGTLTFLYNVRHRQSTGAGDVLLLVLNAAFFFGVSANNLDNRYHHWLGVFAILLAVIYLLLGLTLYRRKLGDDLLFLSLLGTSLSFVTIAIPLQFENDRVMTVAWLVESIILIYAGIKGVNILVRRAGLLLLSLVTIATQLGYPYFYETPVPVLNMYSLTSYLSITGFFLVAHMFFRFPDLHEKERLKVWPSAVIGTVLAMKQISWEVSKAMDYFKLDYSVDFAVSLSWVFFALLLMLLGMIRDVKGLRFISLGLFSLTTAKIMLFDLSGLAMSFRVLILLIVGVILVGVSFIYQHKNKNE